MKCHRISKKKGFNNMKPLLFLTRLPLPLAIVLLGHVCTAAPNHGACDPNLANMPAMRKLDMSRLANKRWYVQELFVPTAEDVFEPPFECYVEYVGSMFDEENYGITHDVVDIFTDIQSGNVTRSVSVASVVDQVAAIWTLGTLFSKQYKIIFTATDYETYGVVHWCPFEDAPLPTEAVMTITGSPNPSEPLLNKLKGMVAGLGFPTGNGIKIRHHAACVYAAEPVGSNKNNDIKEGDNNSEVENEWFESDNAAFGFL